ncbi:hypothetical protein WJX81_004280 [Elliptochloris bilobata]|uniref:Uncharacterized protein n=1 Tax=Elliptochloris bilobata TaxID=381761 RepID=A0AAW1SHL2_9CHLO
MNGACEARYSSRRSHAATQWRGLWLLLLLPCAARGAYTGFGSWGDWDSSPTNYTQVTYTKPASAEVSQPTIAEDYRRWAGTIASAMLLRGSNDQAAGERELASLQSITNKMLADWEAGTLPPQVAKLLATEAKGGAASGKVFARTASDVERGVANTLKTVLLALAKDGAVGEPGGAAALSVAAYSLGLTLEPTLIYIAPTGLSLAAIGMDISPTLINIGPGRSKTLAEGFAIAPTLISVAPVVQTDAQIAADVSGIPGRVVQLPRTPGDDVPYINVPAGPQG